MVATPIARLAAVVVAVALVVLPATAVAEEPGGGSGGVSTPGVVVTAQDPATSPLSGGLRLTLVAGTAPSDVADPSCRPQDENLRCHGTLVLRIADAGGLRLADFEVHMVRVDATAGPGVQVAVHGLAVLTDPGDTGLAAGAQVQVFVDLVDNGPAQYGDTARVRVRPFVEGPDKPPWTYESGVRVVQQVQVHLTGES